jgi:hypothetical protein
MPDTKWPYTVEVRDLVVVGSAWEPIESSWECQNPLAVLADAETAARVLALRADGDQEYRVVDGESAVLASFRVTKRLEVRRPGGVLTRHTLPPRLETPLLSEALQRSSRRR